MPDPVNTDGSARLAAHLKSLRGGLTQAEAGARAGVSPNTWQNLERAKFRPQPSTLRRIADGFNVSYEDLWSYFEDRPLAERFTDAELDRLARRLAPMLAEYLKR